MKIFPLIMGPKIILIGVGVGVARKTLRKIVVIRRSGIAGGLRTKAQNL